MAAMDKAAPPSIQTIASEPLLTTKFFIPQVRAVQVARPALCAQLERGCAGGVMLLSAPADYGKTSLLAAWAA